jgi:hypothetical protein
VWFWWVCFIYYIRICWGVLCAMDSADGVYRDDCYGHVRARMCISLCAAIAHERVAFWGYFGTAVFASRDRSGVCVVFVHARA